MTGEALEVLQTARNDRPQAPEIATVLADVLISEGRTKEVQDLLPKAWEYDPTGRIARLFQARIYLQEGRSYWALLTLEELVGKGDLTVETRFLYARALATEQRWPQARREYLKILRRLPDHYAARMELSSLLRVQGDLDGALQQLEALPEHMNFRPAIRLRRAQLLLAWPEETSAKLSRWPMGCCTRLETTLWFSSSVGMWHRPEAGSI
jgi:thioredoxin-like negative regulator of GroEL